LLKNYLKKILLIALCLAFSGGCASFQHLTTYQEDKKEGPQAADCGSCHVLQFKEWSDSAHAHAYQNVSFQEAFHDSGGEECLGCHAPLEIRQGNTEARSFNRDEGVTCISCHLSQGRMHGPHKSSALLHPHPVQDEDNFYLSVEICAACHGETYNEYRAIAERKEVPACLACHAATRQRTASQGTNFFSNALVAFEDEVSTRSHRISLDNMELASGSIHLAVLGLEHTLPKGRVEIVITNNLPHNLPTGTFGEKNIKVTVRLLQAKKVLVENVAIVSNEQMPLMNGDVKRVAIALADTIQHADSLEIRLERHTTLAGSTPAILLLAKTISLSAEKMR
jgi:hypothetical protein